MWFKSFKFGRKKNCFKLIVKKVERRKRERFKFVEILIKLKGRKNLRFKIRLLRLLSRLIVMQSVSVRCTVSILNKRRRKITVIKTKRGEKKRQK